jgi:hypothetical protein
MDRKRAIGLSGMLAKKIFFVWDLWWGCLFAVVVQAIQYHVVIRVEFLD